MKAGTRHGRNFRDNSSLFMSRKLSYKIRSIYVDCLGSLFYKKRFEMENKVYLKFFYSEKNMFPTVTVCFSLSRALKANRFLVVPGFKVHRYEPELI